MKFKIIFGLLALVYFPLYACNTSSAFFQKENYIVNTKDFPDYYFVDYLHFSTYNKPIKPKYRLCTNTAPFYVSSYNNGSFSTTSYLIAIKKNIADSLGLENIVNNGIRNNRNIIKNPENISTEANYYSDDAILLVKNYYKISKIVDQHIYLYRFKRTELKKNFYTITRTYPEPDYPVIPATIDIMVDSLKNWLTKVNIDKKENLGIQFELYFDEFDNLSSSKYSQMYGSGSDSVDLLCSNLSKEIDLFFKNYLKKTASPKSIPCVVLRLKIVLKQQFTVKYIYNRYSAFMHSQDVNIADSSHSILVDSTRTIIDVINYRIEWLKNNKYYYTSYRISREMKTTLPVLLLTLLAELLIFWLTIIFVIKNRPYNKIKFTIICIATSLITLPIVWCAIPDIFFVFDIYEYKKMRIFSSVLFAIIIEMLVYKIWLRLDYKKALILSAVCNAFTYYASTFVP